MKKSDSSIKNISIASIKRHTIMPIDFEFSTVYEGEAQLENEKIGRRVELDEGEKLICSTIINDLIWSVLTTRKIVTQEGAKKVQHDLRGLIQRNLGDFQGWSKQKYTKGFLQFENGNVIPYFIETGNASMVMIYGVDTVAKLYKNKN